MLLSQPVGVIRTGVHVSSPSRPCASAHPIASSFISRLPVPRSRCHTAVFNNENEHLPATPSSASTVAAPSKAISELPARNQRQPLTALSTSEANVAVENRLTAVALVPPTTADAAAGVQAIPEQSRGSPRARRQWVKSMDVLPAMIPALLQCSPNSANSDGSVSSDDSICTPDRSDMRQPHFDPALTDTPIDVKASTIATLQASISDMQSQHAAALASRDDMIQAVTDELQQCRVQLEAAQADTIEVQQHLDESAAQVMALRRQLGETEAKWRTAQQRLTESKQREGEMKELRRQLAAVSMELSKVNARQLATVGDQSDGRSEVETVRLPVLVGDCIKRQRKAAVVG